MSDRRRKKKNQHKETKESKPAEIQKDKIIEKDNKEDKKEENKEEDENENLEIKPEEIPLKPNSLKMDILLATSSMQHQNGLRVGDYLRFSHFCRKKFRN